MELAAATTQLAEPSTQLGGRARVAPSGSEQALVAAVRDGDDRAFGALYSRYERRIRAYIFGQVADHGRAEDIAQEVFISALRRLRNTERPVAFKPWIYEIARNACIDEYRRTCRTREVSLDDGGDGTGSGHLLSSAPSPDDAIESKQRLDDLRDAFRGLSDNHHRIIVMREFEGRSYGEIGARMGMSRPMVESTLFRARRRLGEEYQELVSGERCQQVRTAIDGCEGGSVRSLGIRQRRLVGRHLAHCQPCRRHAWMLGIDPATLKPRTLAGKIAAILPLPGLRFWRFFGRRGGGGDDPGAAAAAHQFGPLQRFQAMAPIADPSGPLANGLGRVAAAVAAIVVAGGGVATVASQSSSGAGNGARPAAHVRSGASFGAGGAGGSHGSGGLGGSAGAGGGSGSGGSSGSARTGGSSGFGGSAPSAGPGGSRAATLGAGGQSGSLAGPGFGGARSTTARSSAGSQLLKASSGASAGTVSGSGGSTSTAGRSGASGAASGGAQGSLGGAVGGLGSTVSRTVQSTGNTVKTVTGGAVNTVKTVAGGAVNTVKTVTGGAVNTVKTVTGGAVNTVKTVTGGAVNTVKTVTGGAVNTVKTVTGGIVGTVHSVLGGGGGGSSGGGEGGGSSGGGGSGGSSGGGGSGGSSGGGGSGGSSGGAVGGLLGLL
jgi:RNA polymerase sigma factor (sigma-70 family)